MSVILENLMFNVAIHMVCDYREVLNKLMQSVKHVVCYIRKDKDLMHAIDEYCRDLPVVNSNDLNEKAYWFLHELKAYPICQCSGCNNRVTFCSLKHGYATACCTKHASIVSRPKVAATNLSRYSSTTPLQNKEIRAKINQHNIETYGSENVVESEHFKQRSIETCRKNFGVDYPMQSKDVQKKSKAKCKEKYGVEYVLQSDYAKHKSKETSRKLYGTDHPMQSDVVKEKSKKTLNEHFGVDAPAQCPKIRRKQQLRCEYNGMNFDSIYEVAYYIWLVDHDVKFEYEPEVTFTYEYAGKSHVYMPDFKVDGKFIEIKGDHFFNEDGSMKNPWDSSLDGLYESKHQCMLKNNVKIVKVSEMKDILMYITETYGKSYLKQFRRCSKKV